MTAEWSGRIYVDGSWVEGSGGTAPVIEPATGDELGHTGRATADDVRNAAASAVSAQREWAALPHFGEA